MKKTFLFLLLPVCSFAQKIELGVGAGISLNSKPSENLYFKGEKTTINPAATVQGFYNINERWQAGLQLHFSSLSGKSTVTNIDSMGHSSSEDKRFVYAKTNIIGCAVVNARFPAQNGYVYGGAALGYGVSRHDSKTLKSKEAYRTPDGGKGVVLGLQVGYVRGITKHLAVSAEAAFRYQQLGYDTHAGTNTVTENLKYSVMSFPVTVGIRYQLFTSETREKERQDMMNSGATE